MKKPSARSAAFDRHPTETRVRGRLVLDGRGQCDVSTGIRFLDHMLELFTRHGGFDLTLRAAGDLDVDQHHTVEDVGITLGEATLDALGNRRASTGRATLSCRWTRHWRWWQSISVAVRMLSSI